MCGINVRRADESLPIYKSDPYAAENHGIRVIFRLFVKHGNLRGLSADDL